MIRAVERVLVEDYWSGPEPPAVRVFKDEESRFEMSDSLYREMGSPDFIAIRVEAKP